MTHSLTDTFANLGKLSIATLISLALIACEAATDTTTDTAVDTATVVTTQKITETSPAVEAAKEVVVEAEEQDTEAEVVITKTDSTALNVDTYTALNTPIIVSTGDKIEVIELFWFGCGHCYALEPRVQSWVKNKKTDNVEFIKVPAIFSKSWEFHGKAFYTMKSLGVLEKTQQDFFEALHIHKKTINTVTQLSTFLVAYDITPEQTKQAFNSFEVDTNLRYAKKITNMSGARGVPAILVDGKYNTGIVMAGGETKLFGVVDKLIEKAISER